MKGISARPLLWGGAECVIEKSDTTVAVRFTNNCKYERFCPMTNWLCKSIAIFLSKFEQEGKYFFWKTLYSS